MVVARKIGIRRCWSSGFFKGLVVNILTITIARDEEQLIPYFVRHYRQFGDVKVFDDASEDGTVDAARAAGRRGIASRGP